MTSAYPLVWPDGFPRSAQREKGGFKTTLPKALDNVHHSLSLFGHDSGKAVTNVVLSSNVTLGAYRPADPGVAAWFSWEGQQICIPVDRYTTVESNLQAIHHVLEARRVELRHGTLALVRATFRGFAALPAPTPRRPWPDVLRVPVGSSREQIEAAFRSLAKTAHPDVGGSTDKLTELTRARDEALQEGNA